MNKSQEHINKLGHLVTEKVTGFVGVIVSVSFDINGCIQGWVQPPMKADSTVPEGKWFDIARLELADQPPVMISPNYVSGNVADGGNGASEKGAPNL